MNDGNARTPRAQDQAKADIRVRAEKQLAERLESPLLEAPDKDKLVHELSVHQIELEIQNEQLMQTQAALEASRDRYQGLFEQAPVGYVVTALDGLVTEANPLAAQMLGLTVPQLLRRRLSEYFAQEHRARYQAACARLLRDGGTEALELDVAPARGPRLSVALRFALVADEQNSTRHLRVAMVDVTERMRLQMDHARLAAIVESSDDAIISRDGSGRIVSWNRGAERLLGFSADQMVGQPLDTIVPPERRAEDAELLLRLRQGQKLTPFESELRHSNGFRVPVLISLALVHDNGGRGFASSLIARDVSERKRAERALHKRLRQLDVLSQAGQALILAQPGAPPVQHELFDRVRLVVGAEIYLALEAAGAPNVFHLTASHGLSEGARAALSATRAGESLCGLTAARRTPLIIENLQASTLAEAATLRGEGVRSYAGFPLLVEGEVSAVAEFASITRDQFREGDLQVMQTVCDQVAAMLERNRLLQELNEREYSLRLADRRKDDFIATLAHELRNPLAPIRNAVSILRRSNLVDPQLAWCRDVIERQVLQMTRLLEDLLDVSRVTRNKIELRRERVELTQVLEDAIETTRPLIDAQRHRLTITLPDQPVVVWGDLTRLTQVIGNLLNNAAKYTDTGGHIDITVEQQADEVAIAVRDSGIGIEPLQVPRVFDMFAQLKPALERSRGGLGIGLSLSHALVEMHGGRIEVHSDGPGRGSTFTVSLPVVHQSGDPGADPETDISIAPPAGGRRVLVIDDNADAAQTLATMLLLHGFETRLAFGGKDGLRIAEEWQPDVAVIDIGMPHVNGYEVCRLIRQQPWGERMLTIACTGWGQNDDRERARAAGFDVHLVKPIKPDELIRVMSGASMPSALGPAAQG